MVKAFGMLVGIAIFLVPLAIGLCASRTLSARSREHWALLAWVPPLPLAAWWLYLFVSLAIDPTSHNLWPFEMVVWFMVSVVLFVIFLIARYLMGGTLPSGTLE